MLLLREQGPGCGVEMVQLPSHQVLEPCLAAVVCGVCLSACLLIPAASVPTAAPPTSRPATRWACRDDSTGAKTGAQLSAVCCNASFSIIVINLPSLVS